LGGFVTVIPDKQLRHNPFNIFYTWELLSGQDGLPLNHKAAYKKQNIPAIILDGASQRG
jgi:hypothetical protein